MELMKYDIAVRALAEAKTVDEVLRLKVEAEAMAAYARQAKNKQALADLAEIKRRAVRKVGLIMKKQPKARGGGDVRTKHRGIKSPGDPITLAEAGIDKDLAKDARRTAAMTESQFADHLVDVRTAIVSAEARVINAETKAERRAEHERTTARKIRALPEARFGIIVADPEWRFKLRSAKGLDRAADNHYSTSELADIAARDVPAIAAKDCILFLWATVPMLAAALKIMEAWGFTYVSDCVQPKPKAGTGYWNQNQHELLLIGTKGSPPAPRNGAQWGSSILPPFQGRHSEKPEYVLEKIEAIWPNLPKIELNRRGPSRPGWSAWGTEVEE